MNLRAPEQPDKPSAPRRVNTVLFIVIWCLVLAAMFGLAVLGNGWFAARFGNEQTGERIETLPHAAPDTPPQPTIGPDGEVMQPPVWARQPVPEYPEQAMRRGVESGVVELRCVALVSGELDPCRVMAEDPAGAGFGEAALRGVRDARVVPRTIDGRDTPGMIQFKVRFRLSE